MRFENYTPHAVKLNNGTEFPSLGLARVKNDHSEFDENGICSVVYGDIYGLPEPKDDVCYIVSNIVLDAAKRLGRTDCVAPASGHPDTVRNNGFIVSVPGFIR